MDLRGAALLALGMAALPAPVRAAPPALVITHRLADERAAAAKHGGTPVATVADTTRYVVAAPVAAPVPIQSMPRAAPDGTLAIEVACPEAVAGRDAIVSVSVPAPPRTGATRTRCERAGDPVRVVVPGVLPGMPVVVTARAVGLPERVQSDWLSPRAGARLRVGMALAGNQPGERSAPVHFRVVAEGRGKPGQVTLLERNLDAASPSDRGWVDVDVPLDPARGLGTYRLSFDAEVTGTSAGFPVWSDPLVLEPASAAAPWNLLLVSLDTLRADRLGCYGNRRATSPTIDGLAKAGALFPVTVAPAPWTLPSHVSMMTGLYGCAHGMVRPDVDLTLSPAAQPLAAVLRARGYATAAFTEDAFLEPRVFQRGFGIFRADPGTPEPDRVARTMGHAGSWLRTAADAPFFLFVHTYQTHAPYRVPAKYQQIFTTWEGPDGPRPLAEGPPGSQEVATYDTTIRYTDEVLGTLLATLDELGLAGRTVVVVTSDHGEAFWEHEFAGHAKTVYEEEVRVPLVVRAPGLVEAGRRVDGLASLVDVAPTVLELLGVERPTPIQGRSLAAFIRAGAAAPGPVADHAVFIENSMNGDHLGVRGDDWKGVFEGASPPRAFQLDKDPGEKQPQTSGPLIEKATAKRRTFDEECARTRDALAAAAQKLPTAPTIPADPAHRERLRALGYIQ